MKRLLVAFAFAAAAVSTFATGVRMKHTVILQPGWNAFFLPITLDEPADAVFAGWPVETVGYYDKDSFLNTRQFETSAEDSSQGAIDIGMKMWKRDDPGHTSFFTLVANGVYVTVNTNRSAFTAELYGEPAAYRLTWHVSDGVTAPLNYIGISSAADAPLTADGYFSGLGTDWQARYKIDGIPTSPVPRLTELNRSPLLPNGGVVAMDSAKIGDWGGVLNVSPTQGLDLGTNLSVSVVSIRNDAATNRLVRVSLREGEGAAGVARLVMPTVMYLDPAMQTAWQPSLKDMPYTRELASGETLKLRLAIDRERELFSQAVGTEYGGIIEVADASTDFPSNFRTAIPFSAQADGGTFCEERWPKGLWVASVTLDKVGRTIPEENVEEYEPQITVAPYTTYEVATNALGVVSTNLVEIMVAVTNMVPVLTAEPIPVAKPMTVRLLVHVDAAGAMNLMQRARFGGRRLTAAVLPTDTPVLPGSGAFGGSANFRWAVSESSKVNPFRHAKHPDHDGKSADFDGPAPSGDDFNNYLSTVKPELFSIMNDLTLDWSASAAAAWSPEETLTGTCAWSLRGLRREGALKMSGTFRMTRLSSDDLENLKEGL